MATFDESEHTHILMDAMYYMPTPQGMQAVLSLLGYALLQANIYGFNAPLTSRTAIISPAPGAV